MLSACERSSFDSDKKKLAIPGKSLASHQMLALRYSWLASSSLVTWRLNEASKSPDGTLGTTCGLGVM
jgi:hypothetical protein